jgi:ABC-type uncharacterized transport system substrate-binding protein
MPCRPAAAAVGIALALSPAAAGTAAAHPHVWITDVTTFLFEGRELVALRHRWAFDTLISSQLITEHDKDGDGTFDTAETKALREGAFASLKDYGYFTQLRIGGDRVPLEQAKDFAPSTSDGTLIYEFTLPLPAPVDPSKVDVAVGVYDPDYYIELLLDEHDPVRFVGLPSGACTYGIAEDVANPIYFGMVYPLAITLSCATS